MPWKYNNRTIRAGKAWTGIDGIQHPRNWMIWSDAEKTAAGLVWEDDPAPFDSRFYYDANTPRDLDGLKAEYKARTKEIAGSLLSETDWYVIRASENETRPVPSDINNYRISVRAASNTIEAAIDNAADLDAFIALFDASEDENAPIDNWPDEV